MKPTSLWMKHALMVVPLLCFAAIAACGGGGGGVEKSPEQVAAESSAVAILGTTIQELGENAFTDLALGSASAGEAKALGLLATCSSGMVSSSACAGGGTSQVTADCTVETGGDGSVSHVVIGSIAFDACGTLPLSGAIDFTMQIGPIASSCLVGSPIEATLQNNAANPFSSGGVPVHLDATLSGTVHCDAFELFVSDSHVDICPFVCAVSEAEPSAFGGSRVASCSADTDCDRIADESDNCPDVYNPSQTDITDENDSGVPNGIGDACEYVASMDFFCDPADGECDVLSYSYNECNADLCRAGGGPTPVPFTKTCGNGTCEPLNGECSAFAFCDVDCDVTGHAFLELCRPDTWGNGVCEEWENDLYPEEPYGFSVADCACVMTTAPGSECQSTSQCGSGTICRPVSLPPEPEADLPDYYAQILSTPCACMTCGNGIKDASEECDSSAGAAGACAGGAPCSENCECLVNPWDAVVCEPASLGGGGPLEDLWNDDPDLGGVNLQYYFNVIEGHGYDGLVGLCVDCQGSAGSSPDPEPCRMLLMFLGL